MIARDSSCRLTAALVTLLFAASASASETPNSSTNWAWPAGTVLSAVDFTTTVTDDPGHAANVFWSNQFDFDHGGTAYTGMQTNGGKPRNFLFSVWKANAAKPGSPGSHCEDFQENGAGKTCGMHFDWQRNHVMRFRLAAEGGGWFGVTVSDLTGGTSFKIGSIHSGAIAIAIGNMSSWVEYFEWNFDTATCFNQPYSRAAMALPVGNGGRVTARVASTDASGDSRKPGACRARVTKTDDGTVHEDAIGNSSRGPVASSGLCLDAFGGGDVGSKAIAYRCNGQDNQAWVLGANRTMQLASNLCLQIDGVGQTINLQPCSAKLSQQWLYKANRLSSAATGLCVTARVSEAPLTLEPCNSHAEQTWIFDRP